MSKYVAMTRQIRVRLLISAAALFALTFSNKTVLAQNCLQSQNAPGRYVYVMNSEGYVSGAGRTQFEIVEPGLAGRGISFKVGNRYLRHKNLRIYLEEPDGSQFWKTDATFIREPGLKGSGTKSYRPANNAGAPFQTQGYYLRHSDWKLFVSRREGDRAPDFPGDASFREGPCAPDGIVAVTGSYQDSGHDRPDPTWGRGMASTSYCGNDPESWIRGSAVLDRLHNKLSITVQLETDSVSKGPKGKVKVYLLDASGKRIGSASTDELGRGGKPGGQAVLSNFTSFIDIEPGTAGRSQSLYVEAECTGSLTAPLNINLDDALTCFIREVAESGVWGTEFAPKMMAAG